jgi:hypothetical protein
LTIDKEIPGHDRRLVSNYYLGIALCEMMLGQWVIGGPSALARAGATLYFDE